MEKRKSPLVFPLNPFALKKGARLALANNSQDRHLIGELFLDRDLDVVQPFEQLDADGTPKRYRVIECDPAKGFYLAVEEK